MKYCKNCGCELKDADQFCGNCGANQASNIDIVNNAGIDSNQNAFQNVSDRSRAVAAIFAWFLGVLGVHNFYLGNNKKAVIQLVLTCCCFLIIPIIISTIWALVDFITILCGTYKDSSGKTVLSWGGKQN